MRHAVALCVLLAAALPGAADAQSSPPHMMHGGAGPMDQGGTMHHGGAPGMQTAARGVPTQPGQAAFGAIQEIVQILEDDPRTDWSKVDLEALRQHLIDMNNVTLQAQVKADPVDGGLRFTVTGPGPVQDSIRRMVQAHSATTDGVDGWHFAAADIDGGATFTVLVPSRDVPKLRGLGFIGVMTRGMHHQEHHLMLARGENPHR